MANGGHLDDRRCTQRHGLGASADVTRHGLWVRCVTTHQDTHALILDGTHGLGLAVAKTLLDEGCHNIVITGQDLSAGYEAAKNIGVRFLACDPDDVDQVQSAVLAAHSRMGRINALVCTGTATDCGQPYDTMPELWDQILAVNTKGHLFALQKVVDLARKAKHGASVVNLLSIVAPGGQNALSTGAASKAAFATATQTAADAFRGDHIRVNGIHCGWTCTPREDSAQTLSFDTTAGRSAQDRKDQPSGLITKTDHVAELVAYMLGPRSGVMTGSIVDFDQTISGMFPE